MSGENFLCVFCCRFFLENFVLDKHVRYILTIYPFVIWAVTGVFSKNNNAADPSPNNIFTSEGLLCQSQSSLPWMLHAFMRSLFCKYFIVCDSFFKNVHKGVRKYMQTNASFFCISAILLAAACVMCTARIALVTWKHIKRPLYKDASADSMSPMEIAGRQKNIFI